MKKIVIAAAIGFLSFPLMAQEGTKSTGRDTAATETSVQAPSDPSLWGENKHNISLWIQGGLSTLSLRPNIGDYTPGLGGGVGLGYEHFLTYHWSWSAGAELFYLQSKTTAEAFSDAYNVVDGATGQLLRLEMSNNSYVPYGFGTSRKALEQKQVAGYVNIPVMARYYIDLGKQERHRGYAGLGLKLGIPVVGTYKTTGLMDVRAYALNPDGTLLSTDPLYPIKGDASNVGDLKRVHGLGPEQVDASSDLSLRLNLVASAEVGVKWRFNRKWSLSTAIYFDYGLTDVRKGFDADGDVADMEHAYQYNPATAFDREPTYTVNNLAYARHADKALASRMNTISLGLKVALTFGWKPTPKPRKCEQEAAPQQEKPCEAITAKEMKQLMDDNREKEQAADKKLADEIMDKIACAKPAPTTPTVRTPVTGFKFGSAAIVPEMKEGLDRQAQYLLDNPNKKVKIIGHTDNVGKKDYNYMLGLRRAESVRTYLIREGVDPTRLSVESRDFEQPRVPNDNPDNRLANRRVEVTIETGD